MIIDINNNETNFFINKTLYTNIEYKLKFICNKLSKSLDKQITYKIDQQYCIELFMGTPIVYLLYADGIPIKVNITEELLDCISNEKELRKILKIISEAI